MIHEFDNDRTATATASSPLSRGPQPGWMTLNQARERAFTGEIVFETEPELLAYLDNGVVYYAERASSTPLGRRLVEAGVLDDGQLDRGTVRVGEMEHLGRLFDRDPSVDRDAVLVVTEALTDELVTELANEIITTNRSTAYRHHPSGLHRWFASPVESSPDYRPGMVSSLETSVLDDLPGLPMLGATPITDQLYIEWDEPVIGGTPLVEEQSFVDEFDESMLQAMLDGATTDGSLVESPSDTMAASDEFLYTEAIDDIAAIDAIDDTGHCGVLFDLDELPDFNEVRELDESSDDTMWDIEPELAVDFQSAMWPMPQLALPEGGYFADAELADEVDEFEVVWPNGESEVHDDTRLAVDDDLDVLRDLEVLHELESPVDRAIDDEAQDGAAEIDDVEASAVEDLTMTPIETFDDEILADVPADVADAVKRAIAALEAASIQAPTVAPILQPSEFEEPSVAPVAPVPVEEPELVAVPAPSGFAPPSLDMSAEAIYARLAAQQDAAAERPASIDPLAASAENEQPVESIEPRLPVETTPTPGVASVVFVDDDDPGEPDHGGNERSSALRRLIGSLRRRDR